MSPEIKKAEDALADIIEKISILKIYEKRAKREDYCEIVIYNKDNDQWKSLLAEMLGEEITAAKRNITEEDFLVTKIYGGIGGNQSLFRKKFENQTLIAMFWPWQDNEHTTLKMIVVKR